MKNLISKYSIFVIKNPLLILSAVLLVILIASQGITNFKLDASSDALVLEGDESLKHTEKTRRSLETPVF